MPKAVTMIAVTSMILINLRIPGPPLSRLSLYCNNPNMGVSTGSTEGFRLSTCP
jgi:hypothetical protein